MAEEEEYEEISEEEYEEGIGELFNVQVKGKVDPIWRLQRLLERCNILAVTGDEEAFGRAVEVLLGELPISVKRAVEARQEEYMSPRRVVYQFRTCMGVPLAGTPSEPLTSNPPDSPFYDPYLPDVPLNPIPVEEGPRIDYFALLEIIKEELEKANLTWEHRLEHKHLRKIESRLPEGIVSGAEKLLIDYIMQVRAEHSDLRIGWKQLLGELLQRTPALPVLKPKEEEEENE